MKPGETMWSCASMVFFDGTSARSPTATMTSPRTPTSPRNQGAPVPSRMRPFVIFKSSIAFSRVGWVVVQRASSVMARSTATAGGRVSERFVATFSATLRLCDSATDSSGSLHPPSHLLDRLPCADQACCAVVDQDLRRQEAGVVVRGHGEAVGAGIAEGEKVADV